MYVCSTAQQRWGNRWATLRGFAPGLVGCTARWRHRQARLEVPRSRRHCASRHGDGGAHSGDGPARAEVVDGRPFCGLTWETAPPGRLSFEPRAARIGGPVRAPGAAHGRGALRQPGRSREASELMRNLILLMRNPLALLCHPLSRAFERPRRSRPMCEQGPGGSGGRACSADARLSVRRSHLGRAARRADPAVRGAGLRGGAL